ncbi:MAG: RNA methyltransferase [Vampirovibrionales bacterium]
MVVLVDIQDPGNMGTIIRSACAFGAAALMTVGNCTDPFSPKVIRASAGQVFRLPLIEVEDTATLIAALNTHPDLPVYATTPNQGRPYQYYPSRPLPAAAGLRKPMGCPRPSNGPNPYKLPPKKPSNP